MIVGACLSRKQIIAVALVCAFLQEAFSDLPENEALVRLVFSSAGFIGAGLFVSELLRNRRIVLKHVEDLREQIKLRQDAEEELRILVESSPAAIITIDSTGKILLSNEAAQQLLAPGARPVRRSDNQFLPALIANRCSDSPVQGVSDGTAVQGPTERR
jgi:two-component system, LuxR family, sensor kinase FixL